MLKRMLATAAIAGLLASPALAQEKFKCCFINKWHVDRHDQPATVLVECKGAEDAIEGSGNFKTIGQVARC